jgi:hypothetical protein
VDADGLPDLLVGDPQGDSTASAFSADYYAGAAYLVLGISL